jgi:hypothetical protein
VFTSYILHLQQLAQAHTAHEHECTNLRCQVRGAVDNAGRLAEQLASATQKLQTLSDSRQAEIELLNAKFIAQDTVRQSQIVLS